MNPRLSRPLLAIAISGALAASGAVFAGPAAADPSGTRESSVDAGALLADPEPEASDPTAEPSGTPSETPPTTPSAEPSVEPSTPATEPETEPSEPSAEPSTPPASLPAPNPSLPSPSTDPSTPPTPDTTAPTGKFSINTTTLWSGQSVTLTQGAITDNQSTPEQITRVVNWGDNTTSTLRAGQAPIKKRYAKNGKYTITFTLKDAAGNSGKATAANPTVNVVTPGKFKLNKTSVWSGQIFTLTISSVPAGTTKLALDWGDGWVTNLAPKNQTVRGYYYKRKNGGLIKGGVTLRVTFTNKIGASSAIYAGKVTVKTDSWKPVVKVKKPKNANRIKSWKTVTGTATDKGSGVPYVYAFATRITGTAVYCYTPQKKWKRVYTEEQFNDCRPLELKVNKGKWSFKLNGLKKGTLYIDAKAWDRADNASKWASIKSKITKS